VTLRLCAVQLDPELGRSGENTERAASEIRSAAREGARLVVLPEASLTGYVFDSLEAALEGAIETSGPELRAIGTACAEAGAWAVVGAVVREAGRLHNAAFVIGPDGVAGEYRKVHTLCLGVDRFVEPGPGPLPVFDLPFGRLGLNICYDGSFPESARVLRLAGARIIALPTNWSDLHLMREMVRIRARENHVFYLAVNRVGTEGGLAFEGGSTLAGPEGELLVTAGAEAGRFHAEVDLEGAAGSLVVVRAGEDEFDRLADRRPELYGSIVHPIGPEGRTGGRRRLPSSPA